MRTMFSKFALAAGKDRRVGLSLLVATVFMFGCSDEGSDEPPYKPSSVLSSSSARLSSSSAKPSSSSARLSSSAASSSSVSSSSAIAIIYGETVVYHGEEYPTVVIGEQTWFAKNLNYEVEGSVCYYERSAYCDAYGRLYDWATAMALPNDCDRERSICSSGCNRFSCLEQIDTRHKGICPNGWHIPSQDEWTELVNYAHTPGLADAGRYLKTKTGWGTYTGNGSRQYDGNGNDTYGFAALPGGWYMCIFASSNAYSLEPCTFYSAGFEAGYTGQVDKGIGTRGQWWSSTPWRDGTTNAYYMTLVAEPSGGPGNWIDKPSMMSVRCIKD